MITLSPQALQNIEDQFALAMAKALEKVQTELRRTALSAPHWVSHHEAVVTMGWPEILLKKGVKHGHLNPIKFQGKGGTQYDVKELSDYKNWLMDERRANRLPPDYLTNTLSDVNDQSHVLPNHPRRGRPTSGVSGRR